MATYKLAKLFSFKIAEDVANWTRIAASGHSMKTTNPVRDLMAAGLSVAPNPRKDLINMHIGDPTSSGLLKTHDAVTEAIVEAAKSGKFNGYPPSVGLLSARQAIVDMVGSHGSHVTTEDVIMTSGASHALQMCVEAIAEPGQNILTPSPGFPLVETHMNCMGIEPRYYHMNARKGWSIDLCDLESKIDRNTAAIVVNNPSNPTGIVLGTDQLEGLLTIADQYHLPVIADEIYGSIVYKSNHFVPISSLQPRVPVLTCDSISKRYLVPGWRLGWIVIHDYQNAFHNIRIGLQNISHKINGPCALIQGALPAIIENVPPSFFENICKVVEQNAEIAISVLKSVPGLEVIRPSGSMFIMVGLDMVGFQAHFKSELEFTTRLIEEESVFCLPGSAFNKPNFIRLVLTVQPEQTFEACKRIANFAMKFFSSRRDRY